MTEFQPLIQAIIHGEREEAAQAAEELVLAGYSLPQIISDGMTAALAVLGPRCTAEDFNLLEIMLAGRAMIYVMDRVIKPRLAPGEGLFAGQPKVVIGTIQGDIHDLGRHVLSVVLLSAAYQVVDLGKDVPPEAFVAACQAEGAVAIGISSLIGITAPHIRRVKTLCHEAGLDHIRVIAGGAAVTQAKAEYLNVDYVAVDVFDGLNYLLQEVPLHGAT